MNVIETKNAPGAIGPIPRATPLEIWSSPPVRSRWTPPRHYPRGISAQAEQSCKNVGAILELPVPALTKLSRPPAFWRIWRLRRLQRGVRQVFHLQARPQLRGRAGAAQGRALRDRSHRAEVTEVSDESHCHWKPPVPRHPVRLNRLSEVKAEIEFKNLSASLPDLKAYLALRDSDPHYEAVKKNGGIGIPAFVLEDGTVTLDLGDVLK